MLKKIIGALFSPLVFGIGLLAPLTAQVMVALNLSVPGVNPIVIGLLLGGMLGLMAQFRGSWIWIK